MINSNQIILAFTILLQLFSLPVSSQTYTWTQKSDYGGGNIYDPFAFSIGTKGYVGTGRVLPSTLKNDFWEYDPATDIWVQKSDFPGTGRYGAKAFSIGNYGYAGTGWDPSAKKDFYRYDPILNSWSAVADFGGTARYTSVSFSLGNKGYLGLGYAPCKNDFWQYDPTLDTWAQVANFPGSARQAASAFTVGGFGYVGLGSCTGSLQDDIYRFDPLNNIWTPISNFPAGGRNSCMSFAIGDTAYIGLGNDYVNNSQPFNLFSDFWQYVPATDIWQQLPDFPAGNRFSGASFSINNKGYFGMGSDTVFNTNYTSDFWEYAPEMTGISENNVLINIGIGPNPANGYISLNFEDILKVNNIKYSIYNSKGSLIKNSLFDSKSNRIDISIFNAGVYYLVLTNGQKTYTGKFLKY